MLFDQLFIIKIKIIAIVGMPLIIDIVIPITWSAFLNFNPKITSKNAKMNESINDKTLLKIVLSKA